MQPAGVLNFYALTLCKIKYSLFTIVGFTRLMIIDCKYEKYSSKRRCWFLAVFLGIALSLWVDEYQKSKEAKKLNVKFLVDYMTTWKLIQLTLNGTIKYELAYESGNLIFKWCENGQPQNDSINLYLSRLAIATIFVNNEEEYNALKSSGRMELLENEDIVSTLHDYYTEIRYVKKVENTVIILLKISLPFISNYATFYGRSKTANVYSNDFPLFKISKYHPAGELSFYATYCSTYAKYSVDVYRGLLQRVTILRKVIREELSS